MRRVLMMGILVLMVSCEVPDAPVGTPQPVSENAGEPACYQEIECIIEITDNNTLRREAQEVINTLILSEQPTYDRVCEAKSREFTEIIPQCNRR